MVRLPCDKIPQSLSQVDLKKEPGQWINPALAMQAGLIHLSDYVKDTGSIEMALRGYVGHDQDQYIANIRKYGGDI